MVTVVTDDFAKDFKRGFLALVTSGTSEIKTGGGEYGDETVADSLFPKQINNWALQDREQGRKATDAAAKESERKMNPGPAPDATDKLIKQANDQAAQRLQTKQGRRSAFLSGGSVTNPLVKGR